MMLMLGWRAAIRRSGADAGIDGERRTGERKHGSVVDGITEDDIRLWAVYTLEGERLAIVCGDVDERAGDEAVHHGDAGGEDALRRDTEVANTLFDDPVVGGADGPDLASGGLEISDQALHLRKNVGVDLGAEEGGSSTAELGLFEAGVELHHLSADSQFGDVAGAIEAVAGIDPVGGIAGDQSGFDGPEHEPIAGVSAPESAVAVEDSRARRQREDCAMEVASGQVGR
jgi:hypothetical protein